MIGMRTCCSTDVSGRVRGIEGGRERGGRLRDRDGSQDGGGRVG